MDKNRECENKAKTAKLYKDEKEAAKLRINTLKTAKLNKYKMKTAN